MTNKKISALAGATTPLAGTELVPIVQGGVNNQVTVANLTAGRAVSALSLTATGDVVSSGSGGITTNYGEAGFKLKAFSSVASNQWSIIIRDMTNGDFSIYDAVNAATRLNINSSGDIKAIAGNFVQGTAAKGINFTANTPAAGMTSQLLNWYEEGTWTPNQGAGLTVVGAFSSNGTYVRIGKKVFVTGTLAGATSIVATGGAVMTAISLYNTSVVGTGTAANGNANSGAILVTGLGNGNIYAISTIASSPNISFSATFLV